MRLLFLVLVFFLAVGCKNSTAPKIDKTSAHIDIPIYDFDQFEPLLKQTDDKVYIINFWATWCKPCIKELPYFEQLNANFSKQEVEVVLVSLDFPEQINTHLIPFIQKNKIKSKVVLLDDVNSNRWIPLVSEKWSGAIPATVMYSKNKFNFYEQTFDYNELVTQLKTLL